MNRKPGRNEPCPCGSGKKYKKCCLPRHRDAGRAAGSGAPAEGPFRFEPGSYGDDLRGFMPSVLSYKRLADGDWDHHFVLVLPEELYDDQDEASDAATVDLETAFVVKERTGSDEAMALALRDRGYVRVEDFHVVSEEDEEAEEARRSRARENFLQIVDHQLGGNTPPEARRAFERMLRLGHSEDDAKKRIAMLVAVEFYHMMQDKREYDRDGYVAALNRLPELPEELEDD